MQNTDTERFIYDGELKLIENRLSDLKALNEIRMRITGDTGVLQGLEGRAAADLQSAAVALVEAMQGIHCLEIDRDCKTKKAATCRCETEISF